jgi:hypothetical protein
MAKKAVKSGVSDIQVQFMDNGYNVTYSGQDEDDNWVSVRLVMHDLESVIEHLKLVDETLKEGL